MIASHVYVYVYARECGKCICCCITWRIHPFWVLQSPLLRDNFKLNSQNYFGFCIKSHPFAVDKELSVFFWGGKWIVVPQNVIVIISDRRRRCRKKAPFLLLLLLFRRLLWSPCITRSYWDKQKSWFYIRKELNIISIGLVIHYEILIILANLYLFLLLLFWAVCRVK